ncbi:TonB-dependent receptor plug domain-containing protein, partial [Litorivivens sp.]
MTKHAAQRPQRHQTQRLYRHISSPLLALLTASSVVAQPQDNAPRRQLEEVVVTAQKRSQSLTDVPVSVTALSGDRLSDAGIENLSDLSEYAPNFKLVDSGFIPNIYMRGVGSGSNQGFELSVGIFTDGVHLGRPHQTRSAFMDLERVEVLRGPQ